MNKSLRLATVTTEPTTEPESKQPSADAHIPYAQDAFERWLLFLDTLRERAARQLCTAPDYAGRRRLLGRLRGRGKAAGHRH